RSVWSRARHPSGPVAPNPWAGATAPIVPPGEVAAREAERDLAVAPGGIEILGPQADHRVRALLEIGRADVHREHRRVRPLIPLEIAVPEPHFSSGRVD